MGHGGCGVGGDVGLGLERLSLTGGISFARLLDRVLAIVHKMDRLPFSVR